jgi:predicted ATPase/DNA-binding SARP family transcriptional activator
VEIRVLGPLEVVGDDGPVPLPAAKQRQLLAALVMRAGETSSTDVLIEALWGASPPPSAAKLLQVYVSQLRKGLPGSARIQTRGAGYLLELEDRSLDAARFEQLVADGRAALREGNALLAVSLLRRALGLWRGRAYGEIAYEEFARAEAERLEELRLLALEERIEAELALGRHVQLLPELRALAAAEPLRERVQAQAMLALYRCGRQSEALDRYAGIRARLHDELGLEPGFELRELQRRILQHDPELLAVPDAEALPIRLPTPPNRLLGRERELERLHELLLREHVRLLVLAGAGGSGKTRLALEAARNAAGAYANGAIFVDLAPVRDPRDVVAVISSAAGVPAQPGDPLDTLAAALRSRELLLLVDNVEHLREAAPIFVQLLARAPRLTFLVTSRAVLHLSGEHVYPVEPLGHQAALALFLQRARDADARFRADAADEDAIRQICDRLDRLPLAIELAATRVRTLTPAEVLARLQPRLPLLAGGPRDLPLRQQTLRATLEWSLDLLDADERRDLCRLSAFAGGCSLEAAETVCETTLERLSSLVDQNLVRRGPSAQGSRYSLLETIREIAAELLEASHDANTTRRRHAEYVLALARAANLTVDSEGEQRFETAIAERDNIRAAYAWMVDAGEIEQGLELAVALEAFWATDSPRQGIRWFETLLARGSDVEPRLRLRALRAEGWARYVIDDAGAQAVWEEALAQARQLGDAVITASLLLALAMLVYERGVNSGFGGDELDKAERLVVEALELNRRVPSRANEAVGLWLMARIVRSRGDLAAAHPLLEQSLTAARAARSRYWEFYILFDLGSVERALDRLDDAELRCREALTLSRTVGNSSGTIGSLAGLARIASDRAQFHHAGRLWGAVEAAETRLVGQWALNRPGWEKDVVPRGQPEFERACEEGRALSLDEATAYALQSNGAATLGGQPNSGSVA